VDYLQSRDHALTSYKNLFKKDRKPFAEVRRFPHVIKIGQASRINLSESTRVAASLFPLPINLKKASNTDLRIGCTRSMLSASPARPSRQYRR
jgi:hypothetical protein